MGLSENAIEILADPECAECEGYGLIYDYDVPSGAYLCECAVDVLTQVWEYFRRPALSTDEYHRRLFNPHWWLDGTGNEWDWIEDFKHWR